MIDVTFGNVSFQRASQLVDAVLRSGGVIQGGYEAGATEPWIAHLISALVIARGAETVLETGAFQGHTTVVLGRALEVLGGGTLIACEMDPERARAVEARLDFGPNKVHWTVRAEDALTVIRSLPDQWLDVAFIDDDHRVEHVAEEINALWPKMSAGGLMLFHDVYGSCDLQALVNRSGGYSLDLPRCGPAGGLGILQVI